MFRTVVSFTDLQDSGYLYNVGDEFPHVGFSVSEERLAELASANNRRGVPLIKKVDEAEPQEEKPVKKATKRRTKKAEE